MDAEGERQNKRDKNKKESKWKRREGERKIVEKKFKHDKTQKRPFTSFEQWYTIRNEFNVKWGREGEKKKEGK